MESPQYLPLIFFIIIYRILMNFHFLPKMWQIGILFAAFIKE